MRAPPIRIRAYAANDLDAVIDIFQRAIREVACRDYDPQQIAAWSVADRDDWAPHRLSRPAWIAEVDGRPAGFADLEADGHLDMMFVHPDFQGRGVATALLATAERAARSQGLGAIFTEASLTARPFFLRRGFALVARQEVDCHGQRFVNFRMRKNLGRN